MSDVYSTIGPVHNAVASRISTDAAFRVLTGATADDPRVYDEHKIPQTAKQDANPRTAYVVLAGILPRESSFLATPGNVTVVAMRLTAPDVDTLSAMFKRVGRLLRGAVAITDHVTVNGTFVARASSYADGVLLQLPCEYRAVTLVADPT